jgi:OTU-like cysteine protease
MNHHHPSRPWLPRWGSSSRSHSSPYHHPLYVQGREYINGPELIQAAAQQYNITDVEYCNTMAEDCVWGGGPEIVVLCNLLQRPIHVYELITSTTTITTRQNSDESTPPHSVSGTTLHSWTSQLLPHHPNAQLPSSPTFVLRRMACFGSPKYDHKKAIHILSADSRFPDLRPGQQLSAGNHFLAVFPMDENELNDEEDDDAALNDQRRRNQHRRKRIRGGDSSNDSIERWKQAPTVHDFDPDATNFEPMNIVRRLVTQYIEWWQDLFR